MSRRPTKSRRRHRGGSTAGYDEDGGGRGVNPDLEDGANGSGAIYVFSRAGTTWGQDAYLKGSRSEGNDALGYSLAISGDGSTIVAGAGDESCLVGGINPAGCDMDKPDDASGGSAGAAYVWARSGDTWAEQAFIKSSNPELEDWFGVRLALNSDGSRLLVGAPMEDSAARGLNGRQDDNSAVKNNAEVKLHGESSVAEVEPSPAMQYSRVPVRMTSAPGTAATP